MGGGGVQPGSPVSGYLSTQQVAENDLEFLTLPPYQVLGILEYALLLSFLLSYTKLRQENRPQKTMGGGSQ